MNTLTASLMLFCTLWTTASTAGDKEADEDLNASLLAGSCYGCHAATPGQPGGQLSGRPGGQQGAMPDLSYLSVTEVSARLKEYRERRRPATVMSRIASGYSDREIEQLAKHFGRASP